MLQMFEEYEETEREIEAVRAFVLRWWLRMEADMGLLKFIENVLFGLAFGIGFSVAANVLNFIGQFLHASH